MKAVESRSRGISHEDSCRKMALTDRVLSANGLLSTVAKIVSFQKQNDERGSLALFPQSDNPMPRSNF